jgi:hypothetical protein
MLRAALLLLVLANGLFLAWTQGWLAPALIPPDQAGREPQRLALQVNPQQIRVLSPAAASEAAVAAQAAQQRCLEAGPFDAAARAEAEALLTAAGLDEGRWLRLPVDASAETGPGTSPPAAGAPAGTPPGGAAANPTAPLTLRVPDADAAEQARLLALSLPGPGFRPCVPSGP